jgi:cytochrome c oxidase assembly protein subunit 15
VFNSFPLMDGHLLPAEAFDRRPIWLNFFENLSLVQFDHRVLAVLSWVTSWAVWLSSLTFRLTGAARRLLAAIPVLATLQAGVGIATLLMVVPVALAAIHQTIAVLLFTAVLAALHEVRA